MWLLYFLLVVSLHVLLSGNVSYASLAFIFLMSVLYFILLFFAWFADEGNETLTARLWYKRRTFLVFVAWYCLPAILNGVVHLLWSNFWATAIFSWRYHIWLAGTVVLVFAIVYIIRSDYSLRYKRRVREGIRDSLHTSHLRIHNPEE